MIHISSELQHTLLIRHKQPFEVPDDVDLSQDSDIEFVGVIPEGAFEPAATALQFYMEKVVKETS